MKNTILKIIILLPALLSGCGQNQSKKTLSENIQDYINNNIKEEFEAFISYRDSVTKEMKEKMLSIYGENKEITGSYDIDCAAKCSNGTFVGKKNDDEIVIWKGVPYAKQPQGDLRWKPAEGAPLSNKIYEAYYFGHSAVQLLNIDEASGYYPQGEDCLNISIWNNKINTSTNKPIMIYIHGGAYIQGGSCEPTYDLTNFAKANPEVIVASIDYRVNILGFMNLSFVPGGEEYKYSPNLGLLDIVEGLRWVKKNITAFGGDPNRVTVFGESAGSGIVSALTFIPQAKGLITRAIMESGTATRFIRSKEKSISATNKIMQICGAKNMNDLQSLNDEDLRTIMTIMYLNNIMDYTYPECDGVTLPLDISASIESNARNGIDILIGTNKDEMKYFSYYSGKEAMFEQYNALIETVKAQATQEELNKLEQFFNNVEGDTFEKYEEFANYFSFHTHSLFEAKTHATHEQNTFMYYFSEESTNKGLKSYHGFELRYVFGNLNDCSGSDEPADPTLSAIMQKGFINFALTGNPSILEDQIDNVPSLEWKKYQANEYPVMILNSKGCYLENDPLNSQNELVKGLMKYVNGRF